MEKSRRKYSQYPDRDSNRVISEYEAGLLDTRPFRSLEPGILPPLQTFKGLKGSNKPTKVCHV